MAFSGGTFSRTFDCTTDRDNGVKILASKFDTELDGFATGLSTCILKDGTQTCTAAIPFAEGLTVPDNKTIVLGTNSDITIQYDESTNDSLEIAANVEGAALGIVLKADQGDDNADQHKLNIADGGTLTLGSKISGSFVNYLTHTPNSTVASSTTAVAGNLTVGGDLTLGSGAVISEAELEAIDGVTAGTVAASKAVIVDSNKDIASFRNVTLTGELDAGSLDISGDADIDGTLEADAMTLNGTAITATATLDTGISNNNVPKFTSGVADDDFLRVAGTAIEGRSASEVLSDIGGQASLTFGISNTNAVKIDSSSVADDEYARFTANGLESRATSEVLSDIGAAPAAGSSNIVTTGALNSGSITSGFGSIDNGSSAITTTGVITGGTVEATADTSAGDNAAIGYTAAEGLILTGQGSTSDITLKNDADAVVFSVPTGTDDILFPDGAKVIFGAGSDFSINHDASDGNLLTLAANPLEIHQAGTNSALQIYRDTGDGTLLQFFAGGSGLTERGSILTDTNLLTLNANKDFKIKVNNGEIAADFLADGAVNLYHDNSLRLSTTSTGVDVTGSAIMTGTDTFNSAATGSGILLKDSGVTSRQLHIAAPGSVSEAVIGTPNSHHLTFATNNTERLRIDASDGNLLVGKTATNFQSVGVEAKANGSLWGTADGNNPLILVRKSNDGAVAQFYKDSTNVGSIGTAGGRVYFADDATNGITFSNSSAIMWPSNSSGGVVDNTLDIGSSSYRFKDLYLSGGVYLGGTGSANYLDDYEEGTFTPNFTGSGGGEASYSVREGSYTKVGRLVVAHVLISLSSKNTLNGNVQINNLPFTVAALIGSTSVQASGSVGYFAGLQQAVSSIVTYPMSNSINSQFHFVSGTSGTAMASLETSHITDSFNFRATVTYFTT